MNVTLNKTDAVNGIISIEVKKADYADEVDKSLKDLRKNAVLPGFRKGMAPPSLMRQKYGISILVEEINKLVSKSLSDYIRENELNVLGEPLPAEDQATIDFDKQEDFTFNFDIGLSPEIDVKLTKEDKVPYYQIQVNDEMIDKQIEHLKSKYGSHEMVETVEGNDLVKGNLVELDESGAPKAGGITQEKAVLLPVYLKNADEKAKFLNANLHAKIVFNPYKAYDGNEAELSSFLNVKKEEVQSCTGDFSFEINEISRFKAAELNQELFDKTLGAGTVGTEEAFRAKIKEDLSKQLVPESDYKFILDARKLLIDKASEMQLPDAFLKRWLLASDTNKTQESVEEEYPKMVDDLKFHLIKEQLIEANKITIEDGELLDYARQTTRAQFAQYGMYDIPEDVLEKYSQEMLTKKETYRSIGDKIFEDKLMKVLKKQITLKSKKISLEDFQKLFV